ncbi:MAG: phytanoyl-CoA dioxygenase family protein [Ilumatobacteraceae bacterium]
MIRRVGKNLAVLASDSPGVPDESVQLERDGYAVLRGVLSADEIAALVADADHAFTSRGPDSGRRGDDEYRYEMLNHSELAHRTVGHPRILEVIEPLLGDDCHVIANTLWRNGPDFAGGPWHCDAGPHVPRPADVPWDDRIPYPVFAIGAHILLRDCSIADGPTAVLAGSHRSGRLAPVSQVFDAELTYDGRPGVLLEAAAGDVALFVSDVWHRGTPSNGGSGRLFLQAHYGRRDIAQRLRLTADANQLSADAIAWADTPRRRDLVGLHGPYFYDG